MVTTASELLETKLQSIQSIYKERVLNKATIIVNDKRHPLSYILNCCHQGDDFVFRDVRKIGTNINLFPKQFGFLILLPLVVTDGQLDGLF